MLSLMVCVGCDLLLVVAVVLVVVVMVGVTIQVSDVGHPGASGVLRQGNFMAS